MGAEVVINGNTRENTLDQYGSMLVEKVFAGPARAPADDLETSAPAPRAAAERDAGPAPDAPPQPGAAETPDAAGLGGHPAPVGGGDGWDKTFHVAVIGAGLTDGKGSQRNAVGGEQPFDSDAARAAVGRAVRRKLLLDELKLQLPAQPPPKITSAQVAAAVAL